MIKKISIIFFLGFYYYIFYLFFSKKTKEKFNNKDIIKINTNIDNIGYEPSSVVLKDKNKDTNSGILKHYKRIFYNKYSTKEEIEFEELKLVLDKIKDNYLNKDNLVLKNGINKFNSGKTSYDLFKEKNVAINNLVENIIEWLVEELNIKIKNFLITKCIQIIGIYKLKRNEIISIDSDSKNLRMMFIISLERSGIDIHFNIYCDIILNITDLKKSINQLRIMGIGNDEDERLIEYTQNNNCILDNEYCSVKGPCANKCNNILTLDDGHDNKINTFLNDRSDQQLKDNLNELYKCYKIIGGYNIVTKATSKQECDTDNGSFDRQCTFNEECSFYKLNLNYENERGGCVNGKCEFPIGLKVISPRTYDKTSKPFCHNCKKGYDCCDEQYDIVKYPTLKSAHYMFVNDNIN